MATWKQFAHSKKESLNEELDSKIQDVKSL